MSNSLHMRGQYSRIRDSVYPEYPSTACLLLGARHTGEQVADYYLVPEQVFPEQASDGYRASRTGEQDRRLRKKSEIPLDSEFASMLARKPFRILPPDP